MGFMAPPSQLGLNTARTTYGDGGATTRTTGQSMPGGNDDLLNFFKELARRKMRPQAAPAQAERPRMGAHGAHSRVLDRGPQDPPMMQAGPEDGPLLGSYKTIGSQTFLSPDAHGDVSMGYGRGQAQVPQSASFQGGYGPGAQSTPGLNVGYGVGTPSDVSGNPLGAGGNAAAPAIDDWRRQAFISQNPYASGLMDQFKIQDE